MKYACFVLSLIFCLSCAGSKKQLIDEQMDVSQEDGAEPVTGPSSPGSLWQDDNRNLFFQDTKARRVGDLVRVKIVENAKGNKRTATDADKKSSFLTKVTSLFGKSPTYSPAIDVESSNNFAGKGNTTRSGELVAVLSAKVISLQSNGNLKVEGFKEIMINNERQFIKLKGIVRPEDIDSQNTVYSDVIADANIEYTGKGILDNAQRPGWLLWILGYIWPF